MHEYLILFALYLLVCVTTAQWRKHGGKASRWWSRKRSTVTKKASFYLFIQFVYTFDFYLHALDPPNNNNKITHNACAVKGGLHRRRLSNTDENNILYSSHKALQSPRSLWSCGQIEHNKSHPTKLHLNLIISYLSNRYHIRSACWDFCNQKWSVDSVRLVVVCVCVKNNNGQLFDEPLWIIYLSARNERWCMGRARIVAHLLVTSGGAWPPRAGDAYVSAIIGCSLFHFPHFLIYSTWY